MAEVEARRVMAPAEPREDRPVDLLAIGETMLLVAPQHGPLSLSTPCVIGAGGAESNVAVLLARHGRSAAWVSRLGDDALGHLVASSVREHGVDIDRVEFATDAPTGVYFKNPRAESTDVVYYRRGSAASMLAPATIAALPYLPRIVHVSGITAALSDSCAALLDDVVHERRFGAALVCFDVNYRPALWPSVEHAATALLTLARAADVVFVGRDEAEVLWGAATAEDIRALITEVAHLVVKDGAIEAVEFAGSEVTRVPARAVEVVEVVGAGDAFAGGWQIGLLDGLDAVGRLDLAHRCAAAAITSTLDHAVGDLASEAGVSA